MCDATHQKLFSAVLPSINKIYTNVVYIVEDITNFFCQFLVRFTVSDVKFLVPG